MVLLNRILFIGIVMTLCIFLYDVTHADSVWTKETFNKQNKLIEIGYSEPLSRSIITNCKTTENPVHCIRLAGSLGYNESSA
jgi:hypothetical protein